MWCNLKTRKKELGEYLEVSTYTVIIQVGFEMQ